MQCRPPSAILTGSLIAAGAAVDPTRASWFSMKEDASQSTVFPDGGAMS